MPVIRPSQIQTLFSHEKKTRNSVLHSRDISYLSDTQLSPILTVGIHLPTDFEHLKKWYYSCHKGSCMKESCLENIVNSHIFDKSIGSPTGRKEVENLATWFNLMSAAIGAGNSDPEYAEVVMGTCARELLRQVSVHCTERGRLLRSVIEFYSLSSVTQKQKYQEDLRGIEKNKQKEIAELNEKNTKNQEKWAGESRELKREIGGLREEIMSLEDSNRVLKKQNEDWCRRYIVQDSIWNSKYFKILRMNRKPLFAQKPSVMSTVNLRKDPPRVLSKSMSTHRPLSPIHTGNIKYSDVSGVSEEELTQDLKETQTEHPTPIHQGTQTDDPESEESSDFEFLNDILSLDLLRDNALPAIHPSIYEEFLSSGSDHTDSDKEKLSFDENEFAEELEIPPSPPIKPQILKKRQKLLDAIQAHLNRETDNEPQDGTPALAPSKKKLKYGLFLLTAALASQIPQHLDKESYKVGFSEGRKYWTKHGINSGKELGFKQGFTQGFASGHKQGKPSETCNLSSSQASEGTPSINNLPGTATSGLVSPDFLDNKTPAKLSRQFSVRQKSITKIKAFKFHRAESVRKFSSSRKILDKLLRKDKDTIIKRAKFSRGLVNKMISSVYAAAIQKFKENTLEDPLIDVTYGEFSKKYGLKPVCDNKFSSFIASLFLYSNYKRPLIFVKFLGIAGKINTPCFNEKTLFFYFSCLSYILNSKLGITEIKDQADQQICPTNRAIECVREKCSSFGKNVVGRIISQIEKLSIADPKKVNVSGIVELEAVMEILCSVYEKYSEKVKDTVEMMFKAFEWDYSEVSRDEIVLVMKQFRRGDCENELFTKEIYDYQDMLQIFGEGKLVHIYQVQTLYRKITETTSNVISEEYKNIKKIIEELSEKDKNFDSQEWKRRIKTCKDNVEEKPAELCTFAWKIYTSELRKIM